MKKSSLAAPYRGLRPQPNSFNGKPKAMAVKQFVRDIAFGLPLNENCPYLQFAQDDNELRDY